MHFSHQLFKNSVASFSIIKIEITVVWMHLFSLAWIGFALNAISRHNPRNILAIHLVIVLFAGALINAYVGTRKAIRLAQARVEPDKTVENVT